MRFMVFWRENGPMLLVIKLANLDAEKYYKIGRRKKKTPKGVDLESRGPRIDPFRASGPKWGRKWPKNGFWPHLKNGAKMARKRRRMARKMEKMGPKWFENGISGPFSPFSRPCFPHVSGEAKIRPLFGHFRPHFGPEARNGSIRGPRDSLA